MASDGQRLPPGRQRADTEEAAATADSARCGRRAGGGRAGGDRGGPGHSTGRAQLMPSRAQQPPLGSPDTAIAPCCAPDRPPRHQCTHPRGPPPRSHVCRPPSRKPLSSGRPGVRGVGPPRRVGARGTSREAARVPRTRSVSRGLAPARSEPESACTSRPRHGRFISRLDARPARLATCLFIIQISGSSPGGVPEGLGHRPSAGRGTGNSDIGQCSKLSAAGSGAGAAQSPVRIVRTCPAPAGPFF